MEPGKRNSMLHLSAEAREREGRSMKVRKILALFTCKITKIQRAFLFKASQGFAKVSGSGRMKMQKNLGWEARRRDSESLESGTEYKMGCSNSRPVGKDEITRWTITDD